MSADVADQFEDSLRDLGVTQSRTTAAEFDAAVVEAADDPAVGVELPYEGVSLDETDVNADPTPAELDAAATGVTPAAFAVADYGSVVLRPDPSGVEPVSLYPERHVAVLAASDLVADMPAAFDRLAGAVEDGKDDAVIATGPSATADMGALVTGAHGPREVHVIVLEDR
ncbi:LUD domain-containing protein (plasmid) [Halorussus limi]|uniref:LUD domain-containing protein n=1 Tax=Halorussus limi TaxID=2938695 RepID=A0A8U0HZP6_9EURY|nr:LUD domain-containing protein [Halorussus limi]UPV76397.1 LUD domain-containing protein [Halorussus limi]